MASAVHLTSVHWPYDIRIFEKECRSLVDAGYEVTLVAAGAETGTRDGVRIVSVPRAAGRLQRMTSTARAVIAAARDIQADIYHLHDPELLLWSRELARTGRRIVYDMHEDLPLQLREKEWIPKPLRRVLGYAAARAERVLLRKIPVVLAEDSYLAGRPWLKVRRTVLNYPRLEWLADLPLFPSAVDTPRVGYLGTVTLDRGCLRTIEALAEPPLAGLQVGFECIGPVTDPVAEELRRTARRCRLADFNLPGRLPPVEAWSRIAACRVGLALLEPLPNYVESFPTKLFEYMALGIPVVVSDFPLYRGIVERHGCGVAVDPLNQNAIAAAIAGILLDPTAAARMGNAGKVAARRYSWETEKANLLEFYEELLGDD